MKLVKSYPDRQQRNFGQSMSHQTGEYMLNEEVSIGQSTTNHKLQTTNFFILPGEW
jgi:hypothetical protein